MLKAAIRKDTQRERLLLTGGNLAAIPTGSVCGLAANAFDSLAVEQIFSVKERSHYNPLIIHIGSSSDLKKYVKNGPRMAQRLIEKFWPGPLTLLLPEKNNVPGIVTVSLPHVAVRVPDHSLENSDPAATDINTFHKPVENFPEQQLAVLSGAADIHEAASNLYHSLHRLDSLNLKRDVAEKFPGYGLGRTINERLEKAAGKTTARAAKSLPQHEQTQESFLIAKPISNK